MRSFLKAVFGLCMIGLWLLAGAIYVLTLYFAYGSSFWALLVSIFLPFLTDFYWVWHIWGQTGQFFNLLTLLWIGWFGLIAAMTLVVSLVIHADR
jgi:hypothetical protein